MERVAAVTERVSQLESHKADEAPLKQSGLVLSELERLLAAATSLVGAAPIADTEMLPEVEDSADEQLMNIKAELLSGPMASGEYLVDEMHENPSSATLSASPAWTCRPMGSMCGTHSRTPL